jgi:hypothetical protein
MKRWIIPLMVGIVALGTLALAPKAGAATVQGGGTPSANLYNPSAGSQAQQEWNAAVEYVLEGGATTHPMVIPAANSTSHATVSCGFLCSTFTVHFSHADVTSIAFYGVLGYITNMAVLACSALPFGLPAFLVCSAALVSFGAVVAYTMDVAANIQNWYPAWWCAPGQWLCSAAGIPGAYWAPWANLGLGGWIFPVKNEGMDVEFAFFGAPIGWHFAYNG